MMIERKGLLCLVLAGALGAACGSGDDDSGELIVPFRIGNDRACDALGITRVRAELDGGAITETVPCDDGEVRFAALEPGAYEVVMYGLDEDDVPMVDNLEEGPTGVRVDEGDTRVVDPPVALTLAPAKLLVRWDFGFSSCEGAGVATFEVTAWRANGAERLLTADLACASSGGENDYRVVPDPERALAGDDLGEVELQPIAADGNDLGEPAVFTFEPRGAGHEIRLSLTCDDDGCEGSGEPD